MLFLIESLGPPKTVGRCGADGFVDKAESDSFMWDRFARRRMSWMFSLGRRCKVEQKPRFSGKNHRKTSDVMEIASEWMMIDDDSTIRVQKTIMIEE